MLNLSRRQSGFSLIELMIGIAIMAILLAAGAPSFHIFIQNTKIRNAAEGIQSGLNLARAEAVRRNTNVQFALAGDSSWTVGCTTPVGDLDGDGADDCPATIQTRPSAETASSVSIATSEVVASSNAAASGGTFTNTLNFNGLGRITTISGANNAVFDFTPASGTCVAAGGNMRCLRLVASSAGQVRMCDPALGSSNIRGC